ncbi:phosphatase PAP2 family protein [Luteolibacter yonseiensis]|uniref:Phosphatase PAP2 family protein n=2 Tax=Luteolibacter yonseiensis TaxID=1144680 RepID=A0A934R7Q4_9BACT|nr:phosphatase PAP2 family protein [Luteolibacter yonseiensis]MBK1816990.1 phosphatase PAP2 family protein [Luteolibacter yonseiensis]
MEGEQQDFDRTLLLALREPGDLSDPIGSDGWEEMARDITALGGVTVLTGMTVSVIGLTLILRKPRLGSFIAVAVTSGVLISNLLKSCFDRPRPDLVPHDMLVTSASFPSGHAMMSAVVYLTLGTIVASMQRKLAVRLYLIGLAISISVLVGASRVYLGVHWPTDILAGWSLGGAWAMSCRLIATKLGYAVERSD